MTENSAAPTTRRARCQASAAAPAGPAVGRARRAARRGLVPLAIAAVVTAAGAGPAFAADPVHVTQSFGPIVGDVPAGGVCDFAYHEEDSGTENIKRFFDDQGNLIRIEDQLDISILHRNADTGRTLTEELRAAAHVDLTTGQASVTGQSWHLRTEDGRLVLSGAGLIVTDIATGDVLRQTPSAMADAAATICPALGGSPAT